MKRSLIVVLTIVAGMAWGQGTWTDTNSYTALYEMETTNVTAILDTSGNGYSLTNMATFPTWTICGTNQSARVEHDFYFDGSSQYFKGSNNVNGATSITFFAWIKRDDSVGYGGIIGGFNDAQGFSGLYLTAAGTGIRCDICSASTYSSAVGPAGGIPQNEWVFVWGRFKSLTPIELYTNNILAATSSATSITAPYSTKGTTVGWSQYSTWFFPGEIDHAGMFINGANGYASTNTMLEIMLNTHPTNNLRKRATDPSPPAPRLFLLRDQQGRIVYRGLNVDLP